MLEQMIAQESAKLYMQLLEKSVKDKYRGHRDYHLMIQSIRSDLPLIGGEIKVQKEDGNGNFYSETYHVTVLDDLGNPLYGVDDLGGQCRKGEIVKKGFLFSCMKCGRNFCKEHVEFVDNDPNRPLCKYDPGFFVSKGCFYRHWKRYSLNPEHPEHASINIAKQKLELKRMELEQRKIEKELEQLKSGIVVDNRPLIGSPANRKRLPQPKKKGLLSRLFADVHRISCGNPYCNHSFQLQDIICPGCSNTITIRDGDAFVCPHCNEPVKQVKCPKCGSTNKL